MPTKQELEKMLHRKEAELERAERESFSWNKGKYKNSSNAQLSVILAKSLRKEISKLQAQIDDTLND